MRWFLLALLFALTGCWLPVPQAGSPQPVARVANAASPDSVPESVESPTITLCSTTVSARRLIELVASYGGLTALIDPRLEGDVSLQLRGAPLAEALRRVAGQPVCLRRRGSLLLISTEPVGWGEPVGDTIVPEDPAEGDPLPRVVWGRVHARELLGLLAVAQGLQLDMPADLDRPVPIVGKFEGLSARRLARLTAELCGLRLVRRGDRLRVLPGVAVLASLLPPAPLPFRNPDPCDPSAVKVEVDGILTTLLGGIELRGAELQELDTGPGLRALAALRGLREAARRGVGAASLARDRVEARRADLLALDPATYAALRSSVRDAEVRALLGAGRRALERNAFAEAKRCYEQAGSTALDLARSDAAEGLRECAREGLAESERREIEHAWLADLRVAGVLDQGEGEGWALIDGRPVRFGDPLPTRPGVRLQGAEGGRVRLLLPNEAEAIR